MILLIEEFKHAVNASCMIFTLAMICVDAAYLQRWSVRPMTYETFVADFCRATKVCTCNHAKCSCNKTRNEHVVIDTDDDVIVAGMLLAGAVVKEQKRKSQKLIKEVSGHEWIEQRTKHVAYHSLLHKISSSMQLTKHRIGIFLRMDAELFRALLDKVSPTIARQYTVMSRAVQSELDRSAVTLCYFQVFCDWQCTQFPMTSISQHFPMTSFIT